MKSRGKILSLLLAICLVVGLLPQTAFATDTGKAIQLGASNISGYDSTNGYDYIYYGKWNSSPIKWRVLDDQTNFDSNGDGTNDAGLFLLSDGLLGTGADGDVYFQQKYHYDNGTYYKGSSHVGEHTSCKIANAWQGSDAQAWCKTFYSSNLTAQEQGAVLATTKSDEAFAISGSTYYILFDASNNILNGDKVFFLSAEEAKTSSYGFGDDNDRKANYGSSAGRWLLRSPYTITMHGVGLVYDDGFVLLDFVENDRAARPAFNLDLKSVLFTSAGVGGKSSAVDGNLRKVATYDGDEWKLTLLDEARNSFEISNATITDTITFSYSGAATGTNEYISAVVVDNGAITHYGRILQLDGAESGASGTASLTLPDGVILRDTTKLYVFNEQYNGDKMTDYASQLCEMQFDTTAPKLQEGKATRDSENAATVQFTSDEAGTYYYAVVESGETEPTIETAGAGTSCIIGENTISIDGLEGAGEKDIYIVVKDAVGNVSETLSLTIPAATYSISASPAELDFGRKRAGYTEAPDAQTVTLTNTGNQNVTVNLPTSTNYIITEGEGFETTSATLAPNSTASFTVQPNTGLAVGDYEEELTVSGTSGASCTVQLRFAVTRRSSSATGGGGSYPVDLEASVAVETAQHGKVTSSASWASRNTTVTLTAAADEGYQLKSLTVTDSGGKEIELTDKGNGMFTFIMPAGNVTVKAVFLPDYAACDGGDACPLAAYTDLNTGAWYHDGIHYCLDEGLMIGTGDSLFSPDQTLTRAQAVTVLWRLENEPAVNDTMSFADVAEGQWYSEAVRWAASEKLVEGYSDTEFGTGDAITREQLAAILSRYAAYKGYDVSADGDLGVFTDASEISDWAYEAMQWAYGVGLMEGDAGILNPTGDTRRCEFATMMMRFVENIAK